MVDIVAYLRIHVQNGAYKQPSYERDYEIRISRYIEFLLLVLLPPNLLLPIIAPATQNLAKATGQM